MNDTKSWKLTKRGEIVVAWASLVAFLMILGIAGWIEGMP